MLLNIWLIVLVDTKRSRKTAMRNYIVKLDQFSHFKILGFFRENGLVTIT